MGMPKVYWVRLPLLKSLLVQKHGRVCQKCGSEFTNQKFLVVHHLHYRTLGHETLDEDVILVCRPCHKEIHREKGFKELFLMPD